MLHPSSWAIRIHRVAHPLWLGRGLSRGLWTLRRGGTGKERTGDGWVGQRICGADGGGLAYGGAGAA